MLTATQMSRFMNLARCTFQNMKQPSDGVWNKACFTGDLMFSFDIHDERGFLTPHCRAACVLPACFAPSTHREAAGSCLSLSLDCAELQWPAFTGLLLSYTTTGLTHSQTSTCTLCLRRWIGWECNMRTPGRIATAYLLYLTEDPNKQTNKQIIAPTTETKKVLTIQSRTYFWYTLVRHLETGSYDCTD